MTHPPQVVAQALSLVAEGLNDCEISRRLGVNRTTVREWRVKGPPGRIHNGRNRNGGADRTCPRCHGREVEATSYTYLLGMYLGDGYIATHPRGVFRLRIALDSRYPGIIDECERAIRAVRGGDARVQIVRKVGCQEVGNYWKHWPCVFPQHGPGRKHERDIVLFPWQQEMAELHPDRLLRGLIQSDGCRALNKVNGGVYPRYQFSNRSATADIRGIFCWACETFGVPWRQANAVTISIAKRWAVEKLDAVIGPKR
ncbi:MAG: helix-turn-helix domain-containing protein [Actinomycetota bacterium]